MSIDEYDDGRTWYDTAQICLNGHSVNQSSKSSPEFSSSFCRKCGAPTITSCPACKGEIRGYLHMPNVFGFGEDEIPAHCHACGKPYPWTEERIKAARELTDELEGLTAEEKQQLKQSIDDIVADTPRTSLAATRFKRLAAKAGRVAAEGFKEILIGVLSETAKKMIYPGP